MDSEGLNVRRLTNVGNWNDAPAWNPSKQFSEIAYTSRLEGGFDIAVIDLATRQVRQITAGPRELRVPVLGAQRPPPRLLLQARRQVADHAWPIGTAATSPCCRRAPATTCSPTGALEAHCNRTEACMMLRRRHLLAVLCRAVAPRCSCRLRRQEAPARGGHRGPGGATAGTVDRSAEQPVDSGPDIRSRRRRLGAAARTSPSPTRAARAGPSRTSTSSTTRPTLTDEARAMLERNAQWLQEPRRGQGDGRGPLRRARHRRVQPGPRRAPRAQSTRDYLVSLGVAGRPAVARSPTARSARSTRGTTEAACAKNRRAHFAVSR